MTVRKRMRRSLRSGFGALSLAALISVLLAGAAGSAHASTVLANESRPPYGPLLTGSGVAYSPAGKPMTVRRRGVGAAVPDLTLPDDAPVDPSANTKLATLLSLDGGADGLVARLTIQFGFDPRAGISRFAVRSFAGRPSSDLPIRSPWCQYGPGASVPGLGADGSLTGVLGPECGQVSVVDVASGSTRTLDAVAPSEVEVAGRFTASSEVFATAEPTPGVRVRVSDDTGREVLQFERRSPTAASASLELDRDGTAALLGRFGPGTIPRKSVLIASPNHPAPRLLPADPDFEIIGMRLADGQAAMLGYPRQGSYLTAGEVRIHSLADGSERTVLRGLDASGGFDFDGHRLAVTRRGCYRVEVHRVDVASALSTARRRCALRLERRPRLTRSGLRVELSCRGFADTCAPGSLKVRLQRSGRVLAAIRRGEASRARVTVRLSRRERALVRSRGRVEVTAALADAAGERTVETRSISTRIAR